MFSGHVFWRENEKRVADARGTVFFSSSSSSSSSSSMNAGVCVCFSSSSSSKSASFSQMKKQIVSLSLSFEERKTRARASPPGGLVRHLSFCDSVFFFFSHPSFFFRKSGLQGPRTFWSSLKRSKR